jgi:hypothetical protein
MPMHTVCYQICISHAQKEKMQTDYSIYND